MNENDLKFNAIMSSCKYLLPCGRCEMTKKKCTADPTMTYTIQSREPFKNDDVASRVFGLQCDVEILTRFCPNCGADMRKQKLQYGDEDTSQGGLMSAT